MASSGKGVKGPDGKSSKETGEVARIYDHKTTRQRMKVDRTTFIHLGVALVIGVVAMAVIVRLTPPPAGDLLMPMPGGKPLFGVILLGVAALALVFETADSASGMGFGTALTPLLFVLGWEPRQVVPVLLVCQAITGLTTGWFHHRFRNVEFSVRPLNRATTVLVILLATGLVGVVGSVLVTYRFDMLPDKAIKGYVAVVVLFMGGVGLLHGRARTERKFRRGRLLGFAALAGINKGIGGGGYGPVVTVGEILAGVYEKTAAAITSLAEGLISMAGALAFFALAFTGGEVQFALLPSVFLGGFVGALVAPYLVRVVPNWFWRYTIPTYAFVIAGFMLFELFGQ